MSVSPMKTTFVILGAAVVAAASYGGYIFGRSTLPVTIVRSEGREIISSARANATDSTSSTHSGSPHSPGYSVEAFMMVGDEAQAMLQSIVGQESFRYFVYVLPDSGGFQLIVHHDNLTPSLTDDQHRQLVARVRQSLISETAKYRTPQK